MILGIICINANGYLRKQRFAYGYIIFDAGW